MHLKPSCCLLAVLVAFAAGCDSRPARPRLGEVERLPRVETILPEYGYRKVTVEMLATVEPMERARLCAQVMGEVMDLPREIDIGKTIKKKDKLITLYIPAVKAEQENKKALLTQAINLRDQAEETKKVAFQEVEEAQAQVARWKEDLAFRELQLQRVTELVKRDVQQPILREESELQRNTARAALGAAQATVKTKQARFKASEAELRVAASRIEVARADLRLADTKVDFATIRAPFDGIISRRWVDNGVVIKDPAQPLLTVMRTDKVRVLIEIPERYVPMVRATESQSPKGLANLVKMTLGPYELEGQITRMASAIDNQTRLMRAEIHVDNDAEFKLRPGMTGTANVILNEGKTRRLNLPSTALVRVGEEMRVYYVDDLSGDDPPRGKVKMAVVKLGLDDGKIVEITSGLTGKELVIAKGNGVVRQGEKVIAVKARQKKEE